MATKIVLIKKNAKDDFGILIIQSLKYNYKTKKEFFNPVGIISF